MKKFLMIIATTVFILAAFMVSEGSAATTAVISIDTVESEPGAVVVIPVRIGNNDIDFAGLQVPITYNFSYLTIDSISFVGSIKPTNITGLTSFNNFTGKASFTYMAAVLDPIPTVGAIDGIVALIHGRVSETTPDNTTISVDSVNTVNAVGSGVALWDRVEITDNVGSESQLPGFMAGAVVVTMVTAVNDEKESTLPTSFALDQNYPNPFNPSTTIGFALPKSGHVKLQVFNILGQTVATLADHIMSAGYHEISFDGSRHPSGIYFYRLSHAIGSETKKMVMIK